MENFMEDTPLWVAYKKCRGTLSKLRNMKKFIGVMNINIYVGEYWKRLHKLMYREFL